MPVNFGLLGISGMLIEGGSFEVGSFHTAPIRLLQASIRAVGSLGRKILHAGPEAQCKGAARHDAVQLLMFMWPLGTSIGPKDPNGYMKTTGFTNEAVLD